MFIMDKYLIEVIKLDGQEYYVADNDRLTLSPFVKFAKPYNNEGAARAIAATFESSDCIVNVISCEVRNAPND